MKLCVILSIREAGIPERHGTCLNMQSIKRIQRISNCMCGCLLILLTVRLELNIDYLEQNTIKRTEMALYTIVELTTHLFQHRIMQ